MLGWKVTNAGVKSHGYEAKAELHSTGSTGTAAVLSFPDGTCEYNNG